MTDTSLQSVHPGLGDQAFGRDADALVTVEYQSHKDALRFVRTVFESERGVGVLHGPEKSGKTTIVERVRNTMPDGIAVALVDGTDLRPRAFLSEMLRQFGYDTGLQSTEELLQMVEVFATQQTRSARAPVLIVDNVEHMYPRSLRLLNSLADITSHDKFALRIIITCNKGLSPLIASADLDNIARRHMGIFTIGPLSTNETLMYLHARVSARGAQQPYALFPADLCNRIRELSGGWPGKINHYAHEALRPERVRLVLTRDGQTLSYFSFSSKKVLIGRSELADIVLEDRFASKLHAVLLLYSNALVLLDLNSSNGTTVNSAMVSSTVLRKNDIISIGNHRLRVENAPSMSKEMAERLGASDTVRMKSLAEMRKLREEWLETRPEKVEK